MKMIKLLYFFLLVTSATAQQYGAFTYQGLLLDEKALPISDTEVEFLVSVTNSLDEIYYQESHLVTTDDNGVIFLNVGDGEALEGGFGAIDWLTEVPFIAIEYDLNDGKGSRFLGRLRFKSVLFCLESNKVVCQDGLPGLEGAQGAQGAMGGSSWPQFGPEGNPGEQGAAGADGRDGLPIMEQLDLPPSTATEGKIYLDDGTNRADTRPGFRYYNGQVWIDLG